MHCSMIEHWRWWPVRLWIGGLFEVFVTAVIALVFTRLGLIRAGSANRVIVAETIVLLSGGTLGTLHYLYSTRTPISIISMGTMSSALEVMLLSLIRLEALQNHRRTQDTPWLDAYKRSVLCFVVAGSWSTVSVGLPGFAINPLASLYYVQGLNMTATHGHAVLFGVYSIFDIDLMLLCLHGLYMRSLHTDRLLRPAFWGLGIGLAIMVSTPLLPTDIYQAWVSATKGMWYARSPEVMHSKVMETLVWLRVPGDIVFAIDAPVLTWYTLRLPRRPKAQQMEPLPVSARATC